MTPSQFIKIRVGAGLSIDQLSGLIRFHERTTRRYEDDTHEISGPVSVLMGLLLPTGQIYTLVN